MNEARSRLGWSIAVAVALGVGCGGGDGADDVPSCQQAMTHYYEAGCAFFDLDTGEPISVGSAVETCRSVLGEAPPSCGDEVDLLLVCLATVPEPSTSNEDCDCSAAQEALLSCG